MVRQRCRGAERGGLAWPGVLALLALAGLRLGEVAAATP
jgi:hypothetical protein